MHLIMHYHRKKDTTGTQCEINSTIQGIKGHDKTTEVQTLKFEVWTEIDILKCSIWATCKIIHTKT